MVIARQLELRNAARSLLNDLWRKRGQIWIEPPTLEALIPIPTEKMIRCVLDVILEEPEAIPPEKSGVEIAGFMDRSSNRIVVAQKYSPEIRRFTMGHEIAHWVLHPGMFLHRVRPLCGGERMNVSRPKEEQEADIFASELLMPEKLVKSYFEQRFGKPIGIDADPDLIFWLASGQRRLDESIFQKDRRYRALAVARAKYSRPAIPFPSLAERFGVSATAMAITLEDFGLVN